MRLTVVLGLFTPAFALANTPVQLSYSGRLADSLGAPLSSTVEVGVSLHTAETGGSLIHDEEFALTPADGYFSVQLGEDTTTNPLYAAEIPTTGEIWVQVEIDDVILGSRSRLASGVRSASAINSLTGVLDMAGVRKWGDGTSAASCLGYLHPPAGKVYSGDTGSGVYSIDPTGGSPFSVVCDMTRDGGGWTLLMKAAGTTFSYDSTHWTTSTTHNPTDLDTDHGQIAKFDSFNTVDIVELMADTEHGSRTVFAMPTEQTALELFQATGQVMYAVSGARTPAELINGQVFTFCGQPWRTNSHVSGSGVRLGGYVQDLWDCSYGTDPAGESSGAHLLGFGTRDTRWGPGTYANKSFGVRDAHDNTYVPPGQGSLSAHLWGR